MVVLFPYPAKHPPCCGVAWRGATVSPYVCLISLSSTRISPVCAPWQLRYCRTLVDPGLVNKVYVGQAVKFIGVLLLFRTDECGLPVPHMVRHSTSPSASRQLLQSSFLLLHSFGEGVLGGMGLRPWPLRLYGSSVRSPAPRVFRVPLPSLIEPELVSEIYDLGDVYSPLKMSRLQIALTAPKRSPIGSCGRWR